MAIESLCRVQRAGLAAIPVLALCLAATPARGGGPFRVERSRSSGLPVFVVPDPARQADDGVPAAPSPEQFLRDHGAVFGISRAGEQLEFIKSDIDGLGHRHDTYRQLHRGVPVFSGVLRLHADAANRLVAAGGRFYPIPDGLPVAPALPAEVATVVALQHAGLPGAAVHQVDLVIVDPGWYGDPPTGAKLAYHVIFFEETSHREEACFIDARDGTVLDHWSIRCSAINRQIHSGAGMAGLPGVLIRAEGDLPSGIPAVDYAYDYVGDAYDYFFHAFGRDSFDNLGSPITITTQADFSGAYACPNASWSFIFSRMTLCVGTETDDIIAHEFTHGVTQSTADLIYQNQPGQLNESFSDIFGELVDLFNGGGAFVGETGDNPWTPHPTGPGQDLNQPRTGCSSSQFGYPNGTRWLQAEDSPAFNNGVRDMWQPTCFAHPDSANHVQQTCSALDDGGVHSGSGVLNHAFAIACDGKTFNGFTVSGVGPIKAGAAFYRALTVYLTVGSDFQDAYLAINQAAADLVGTFPNDPRTGMPSTAAFTAADAVEIDKALRAVELDTPGACGETIPTLSATPPVDCASPAIVFADDFDSGASGWTVVNSAPPTPYDWQLVGDLPFDRPGTAWFCEDRNVGDCTTIDETATHDLISPPFVIPPGLSTLTLRFTHFMEVEPRFDGGQVHVRRNNGDWQLVPTAAYWYNRYNTSFFTADTNSNPLAGQIAFSGVGGNWGVSLVDLGALVAPGDTVSLRFHFAKDQCFGHSGWWVDDVAVYGCTSSGDCNENGIPDEVDHATGPAPEVLLSQPPNHRSSGNLSDADPHPALGVNLLAENFQVLRHKSLRSLRVWGGYTGNSVVPDNFTVIIHENDGGLPGTVMSQQTGLSVTRTPTGRRFQNLDEYRYEILLNTPVDLPPGIYLVQLFNNTAGSTTTWVWERAFYGWIPGVAFLGQTCTAWCYQEVPNMAVELMGEIIGRAPGDMNGDGVVESDDAEPFVNILLGENLSDDAVCAADLNADGAVNGRDIDPFVACVLGSCP